MQNCSVINIINQLTLIKYANRRENLRFEQNHNGELPTDRTEQQLSTKLMTTGADAKVSYGLFNEVIKKLKAGINRLPSDRNKRGSPRYSGQNY